MDDLNLPGTSFMSEKDDLHVNWYKFINNYHPAFSIDIEHNILNQMILIINLVLKRLFYNHSSLIQQWLV